MARLGPHQTSPHHAESANVRQQDELHNLEREKDLDNYQEGNLQTLHTGGSGFRRKGHAVHEQGNEKAMQREIDDLKRGNFVEHNGSNPLPALMFLLMTKKILSTDNGQELHLVSLFPVRMSIFTKGNAEVHLTGEQELML